MASGATILKLAERQGARRNIWLYACSTMNGHRHHYFPTFRFNFCIFQSAHIHCNQTPSYPQKELKNAFSKFQFEKWSEPQRKKVIADVLKLSNQSQLYYTDKLVSEKLPTKERDFTRVLPRVLTLYIFSYLDPRTLCRCAQVCLIKIYYIIYYIII